MIDYPAAPLNTVDTHQKQQRILSDLCERGFSVIEDYFGPQFCHLLRHESQDFWQTNQFHPATVGQGKQQRLENSVRGDHIFWIDKPAQGSGLMHYLASLDKLKQHLNQGLFLGLQDHEAHIAVYPEGTYYRRHLDQFKNDDRRSVSVILYLNEQWQPEDGGQLRIYTGENDDEHIDVWPLAGQLVVFLSQRFEHEVMPAGRQRLSITAWLKRRSGTILQ